MFRFWVILCMGGLFAVVESAEHRTSVFSQGALFLDNTVSQKTGQRLVANSDVVAFTQTPAGRVLFTADGAYFGAVSPPASDGSGDAEFDAGFGHKRSNPNQAADRLVVLKAGFDRCGKRPIEPELRDVSGARVNFLVGDQKHWRVGLETYRQLVYSGVWPGVDLVYLSRGTHLEYRLELPAGADPASIVMETGAESARIDEVGGLRASLAGCELRMSAPKAFQIVDGVQRDVQIAYRLCDHGRFGFELGAFSPDHELTIDPKLSWSTVLGGSGGTQTQSRAIDVDSAGNVYITGNTGAADFPNDPGCL